MPAFAAAEAMERTYHRVDSSAVATTTARVTWMPSRSHSAVTDDDAGLDGRSQPAAGQHGAGHARIC